jgi:hypothetical protein
LLSPRRQLRGGAGSPPAKLAHTQLQEVLEQKVYKFLLNYYLGDTMGLVAVFRAKLSSHGGGRLIIYVPKSLQPKLREYYEKGVEFVVHLYTEN